MHNNYSLVIGRLIVIIAKKPHLILYLLVNNLFFHLKYHIEFISTY